MEDQEKQERVIEAAVALLESVPGRRMQVTNLNKALFYLDLAALRDLGHTITGSVYVAMQNGPVLNDYKTVLVGALEARSLARQDEFGLEKPVVLTHSLESFKYLDDAVRGLAASVGPHVAKHSAAGISDLAHRNPGWRIAYAKGAAKKLAPAPIDLYIAMQQIVDRDPWVDEPPDQEVMAAFEAGAGATEPW